MGNHQMLLHFLRPDPAAAACSPRSFSSSSASVSDDDGYSCSSFPTTDGDASPSRYGGSSTPPTPKSPWAHFPGLGAGGAVAEPGATVLITSLVKEDGHVYSLAATGDVLYTGTDSRNVRVWQDQRELAGFRTASGLVKAIVVAGDGREKRRDEACPGEGTPKGRECGHCHRRVTRGPRRVRGLVGRAGNLLVLGRRRGEIRRRAQGPQDGGDLPGGGRNVVVSDSTDRTLCVWRRDGAEHVGLAVLAGHTGPVKCVAMDEEAASGSGGDRRFVVYSGSLDGSVKVWRLSDAEAARAVPAFVMERTPAPPQPSQAWRGRPAPAPYVEAWTLYQTPELKRGSCVRLKQSNSYVRAWNETMCCPQFCKKETEQRSSSVPSGELMRRS